MADFLNTKDFAENHEGYCIRCSRIIPYNPHMPLCNECFFVWDRYKNPDYEEDFCHCCGNMGYTSKSQPECYPCYSENNHSQDLIGKTG